MKHEHSHTADTHLGNAFKIGIAINVVFIALEASYGFLSNSMALLADAGHNLSDVLALVFSWIGVALSSRKPTSKFTYGYRRSTILIALLNTQLLLATVVFIVWEAVERIGTPLEVKSNSMMVVASIGIAVNGFTAWLFLKGRQHDLNIRSAFVHFFADALVSLGVVLAGILIAVTGFAWLDSVVSFIIAAVILYSTYHLLIDSVNLALDAVPENIDINEVKIYLTEIPEVTGVHDLHIWALGTTDVALSVHLETNEYLDARFVASVQRDLKQRFKIGHSTIQIEYGTGDLLCGNNCY